MKLTVTTEDDKVVQLDMEGSAPVENVKAILEIETGIPAAEQALIFNGKQIAPSSTLSACGIGDGDLIMLLRVAARPAQAPVPSGRNPLGLLPDGSAEDPEAFQKAIAQHPQAMAQLSGNNAQIASAILACPSPEALQNLLKKLHEMKQMEAKKQAEENELHMRLARNPMDMEAQQKLMEMINQKNIYENYESAMEYTPESFGRVTMLYVNMTVNGVDLKAFVDSGAQSTIMSEKCAEKCNILRLVDKRFAGVAKGVGTSKIVGRVHQAPLKVADQNLTCSITVLENQDMEFLFGLDMLKRFQCSIDLQDNKLKFGSLAGCEVPFLGEGDLPMHLRGEEAPPPSEGASSSGNAQAAASPAPAAAAPPAADEAKLKELQDMGFTREQAMEALAVNDGNVEQAANYLLGGA